MDSLKFLFDESIVSYDMRECQFSLSELFRGFSFKMEELFKKLDFQG